MQKNDRIDALAAHMLAYFTAGDVKLLDINVSSCSPFANTGKMMQPHKLSAVSHYRAHRRSETPVTNEKHGKLTLRNASCTVG